MPVSGHEETGVKPFAGQFSDAITGVPIKKRRFPSIRPSSPLSEEPCSLTEETELPRKENSSTSQGSTNASVAGAPIKKRRFPFLQASSSPLEEGSPSEESDALRKEHSSISQCSTLSNSSSGLSDTNGNPVFEERKAGADVTNASMVQSNVFYLRPKLEELNLATQSCTLDVMESKEKVIPIEGCEEKLGSQLSMGNPKLLLAAKEGLALSIGADVSRQNAQGISKQESPVVPESTNLSLSLKEPLFPSAASTEIDKSCQKMEKAEPVSLKLSLSKEECSTHRLNSDTKNSSATAHVHSNRANWDLNTTMDAWEESGTDAGSVKTCIDDAGSVKTSIVGAESVKTSIADAGSVKTSIDDAGSVKTSIDDASSVKTSIDGQKITASALDEKHLICSTGMVLPSTSVASVKRTCEESQNKAFIISSGMFGQKYECVNPHNLSLTSCLQKYTEEPSRLSVKLNSGSSAMPTVSLSGAVASAGDVNTASFRMVKSEPFDENLKKYIKEANACSLSSLSSLDSAAVKKEFVEHSKVETFRSSDDGNLKSVDPKFIKSEPCHEGNQGIPKTAESKTAQLGIELPQVSNNCSSAMAMMETLETTQVSTETACPVVKPVCSTELTTRENIVNQLEHCTQTEVAHLEEVSLGACSSAEQVPLETVAIAMVDDGTELSGLGIKDSSTRTEEERADDREDCRLKLMNEALPDPRDGGEGCVSDEEKITLSADMLEDDSYGSDYESDDIHAVAMDTERTEQCVEDDDDYEDGEVREPLERTTAEGTICEVREVEHPDCSNYENQVMEKGVVSGDCPTSSNVEENDNKTVIQGEINRGEEGVDIEMHERSGKIIDKNVCLQESLDTGKSAIASDGNRHVKVLQRNPLDLSERKNDTKALETELSSDQAINGSHGLDDLQCADEVVKITDTVRQTDSDLPKMEASVNTDDVTKDVCNSGNQGRIINLSRAASSTSPSKTRSLSGRSLPSRAGRDMLTDGLDDDKLHRGRDEVYIDGPRKYSRERHQDISPRNSRFNFVRGRGRVNNNRLDSFRGDWESDREFSGEFYNGPNQFRGPRPKYASAIADTELEYNNVAPDGSYVGNGRVGRKPMNDDGPFYHHIASRRRSPGGRESIQMGHRIPRNMSPSRCVGGDGSELVSMRHSEKFMRGFPEDTLDPMLTRSQPFEGLDGQFTRGRRNFPSIQRRGLPRIRSKSPIRSRSRSPGPWSSRRSPRRRSPDGFGGHPELSHRRSPLYRVVDRIRSPDRPVFAGERVVRRHGSPSYMSRPSNDIRDIDSARDHGHPRSVISGRSPSGRILIRNRRYDDFFGGPMHSSRLLDLNGEGNVEERRRFGERRGPVRSFRPPYNGAVGENFDLNGEDGPRQYRFCSEDSDFHERGNLRERDFDRRIKGRPGNVPPRRTRTMDEHEENYRHGGQVWSDDGFDDISTVKRKRF